MTNDKLPVQKAQFLKQIISEMVKILYNQQKTKFDYHANSQKSKWAVYQWDLFIGLQKIQTELKVSQLILRNSSIGTIKDMRHYQPYNQTK